MKLELESTATTMQSPFAAGDLSSNGFAAEKINEMLKAGITAAKEGNRAEARALLLRVTESDSDNETAWLWLASISEYPEELLVFLNNVLNINPNNERAAEWSRATKSLLAKTFVQRGITASRENQKDFASQCFRQAIEHDEQNELAWLWLASIADAQEEKMAHLEKVLSLNPENETAQASLKAVRQQAAQALLKKANVAAISGEHEAACMLLDELMDLSPEMEEAWILKAYLTEGHEQKIACFEKVLSLNPENETAQAGIDSLNAIKQRELERQAQRAELERLQAEAHREAQNGASASSEQTSVSEEVPELFFDFNSAAESHSAKEEYPDFNYAEEAAEDEDIHKTSTADRNQAESGFMQEDGPTQELEEEFVQNLEVQAAFGRESEDENNQENQEFFAAENPENNVAEARFSEPAAENEFEEFTQETPENAQTQAFAEFKPMENYACESKDFEIMTGEENSHFQESDSQFEESSEAVYEEVSQQQTDSASFQSAVEDFAQNNGHQPESDFQADNFAPEDQRETTVEATEDFSPAQIFAAETEDVYADMKAAEDEIEEICVDENETLDNYFQVEDESVENDFEEADRAAPYLEDEEAENPAAAKALSQAASAFDCPFCEFVNEPQSFVCPSCQSVLTLSDLEMLLSNNQANRDVLTEAIEKMESEMAERSFSADELTNLGVAHLNAKNLRQGYTYLQQASQMNQNNVVLGGQVNALAIRLDEIEQHESKNQEAKSCTILVVDDSPTVRKLISGKLEKSGHTVVLAVDGMDALAKINEIIPDLVLLDITMPRMDGYQVCKLIRSNNSTKDVPVVMISGKDGFFDKVRGRMAGSTGYITKPFGPDTLMRTIDAYLN